MSAADEGGFDLVIEIAQQLLLSVAGSVAIPETPEPIAFAGISGTFTPVAAVSEVTLGNSPTLDVSISLDGTTIVASHVPWYLDPVPKKFRTINVTGDVTVPVPLVASGLTLAADFSSAGTPAVSQAVFDSIFAAPLVEFLLVVTLIVDPTGGLYQQVKTAITNQVTTQLQAAVGSIGKVVLIDFTPMSAALAAAVGKPIAGFTFAFGNLSVFLLFVIGGAFGTTPTRSDLLRATGGEPADRADLIISNACLLRDLVRPNLMAPPASGGGGLGLTAGGFLPGTGPVPGSPLAWVGSVPFPPAAGGAISSVTINSVIVGVDGTNLRLLVSATANGLSGPLGSAFTVNASIDVTVSVSAAISGGTLTLALTPVGTPAVSSNVSIAWWVYVLGFVLGGFTGVEIIAIANAFADTFANGLVAGLVKGALGPISVPIPLPSGVPALTVRQVSLFQADAPPSLVLVDGFIIIGLPFPHNDVIINFI